MSAIDIRTASAVPPGDSLIRSDGLGDVEPVLVLLDAIPGGQVLEIQILDPTLTLRAPPGLQLLHQSTDARTPTVWADPASGLVPF